MEENNKIIRKKIFDNLIIAVAIMLYFLILNFTYLKLEEGMLITGIKFASLMILFLSLGILEIAYHKDSGKLAIYGIEILVLAIHTLTIWHIPKRFNISLATYLVFSSYAFSIYYLLKSILIYTNEKRKYVNGLSDIHEIVSNTPTKKEAKKRTDN